LQLLSQKEGIVQQIGDIIVLFDDTSMKFGIQIEND